MQYVHITFQVFHDNMRSLYLSIFIWSDIYFISYSVLPTVCFKYHVMYLTIPVVKERCAREALPHTFNIDVFKYGRGNSTTIKQIYNESENLNESYDVAVGSNKWWNLP